MTPKHIAELFCDLAELKTTDSILDPCCGTGGFLIAGMNKMLQKAENVQQERNIRKPITRFRITTLYVYNLHNKYDFAWNGKSNVEQEDFLDYNPIQLQEKSCTVGMMNPPYSMGSKNNPSLYEINFTEHLLDSIVEDGKVIVIVPQSSMVGKSKEEKV